MTLGDPVGAPSSGGYLAGGEMGARIRAHDWTRTSVGPMEQWPQSLRTALSIVLDSRYPMYIAWGPDYLELYNDAFVPILGAKHPAALGNHSTETWAEIWHGFVGPLFAKVMRDGEPTYLEDALVEMNRRGFMEETYFTFCYSPIRDESGAVGGVFVTCMETTARVVNERRMRTLRELAVRAAGSATPNDVVERATAALAANAIDLPFTAVYLVDDDGVAHRLSTTGVSPQGSAFRKRIEPGLADISAWPPLTTIASSDLTTITDLPVSLTTWPSATWAEPPREAAIVPIARAGREGIGGFLVAGINPRRPFDNEYRTFLELTADYLGRATASAQAHVDLENKAEQLQEAAAELEMQSEELRAATDELIETNQRLATNETRLRVANLTAGIGTWELDVSRGTFACDEQCASIMNMPADRRFQDLTAVIHPDDLARVQSLLERARMDTSTDDHRDFDVEFRDRTGGGNVRWLTLTGRTFYEGGTANRAPMRIVGTVHDITTRRRAEEALREETQVVETIQRVGSALASNLDLASLVQTVTDEATKLTGAQFGAFFYNVLNEAGESYTLYSISGVPREAFSRFPMPRNTQVFAPTFHATGIVRSDDITKDPRYGKNAPYYGKPKGHLPVVSYLAVPVVSRAGEVLGGLFFGHSDVGVFAERHERIAVGVAGWAAVGIDNARLYERERRARNDAENARGEAERANKAKTEFLATMSHELRTPLNAIAGYVDLLDLEIRGPVTGQQREDFRRIQRSQQHLLSLINDVLNFAKLEAGQVELHLTSVSVASLLADIEPLVAPQLASKRLTYVCDDADPSLVIRSDEEKTRQILLNLLTNAVKFTDAGGQVSVRSAARGGVIEISVSDTGRGIPPDKLENIFEPFVQIDRHITPVNHQGVGLGLAISRDLARAMGGDIAVTSHPSDGSTFTLSLPRAD